MIVASLTPNNAFVSVDWVKCMLALQGKYEMRLVEGPSIPDNRNRLFEYAEKTGQDLLMVDSDMIFKPEDVEKIETHLGSCDVVTGVYALGRPPYPAATWKRIEGDYELTTLEKGLNEIGACGGGFLGISKRVVEKMPKEPFNLFTEGKITHGEDISFCHRVHEQGFKVWCDSDIQLGHIRTFAKYVDN